MLADYRSDRNEEVIWRGTHGHFTRVKQSEIESAANRKERRGS